MASRSRLVGRVAHDLAVAEVDQLEQARDLAVDAPEHQGVELHLEQRLGLEQLAGGAAGLVVDDPHRAVGGDVEPVDVAAQGEALDLGLDVELAGGRLEPGGVLEVEPLLDEGLRRGEPALLGEQLVVVDHRLELGPLLDQRRPARLEQGDRRRRGALGGREVEEVLEHRVDQRAARGGRGRGTLELVDRPEPEQQRALLEVRGAARGQGGGHGAKVCRGTDIAVHLRDVGEGRRHGDGLHPRPADEGRGVSPRAGSRGSGPATARRCAGPSPCARRTTRPGRGRAGRRRSTGCRGARSTSRTPRRPATSPSTR